MSSAVRQSAPNMERAQAGGNVSDLRRCARRSVGCQYAIHVHSVARATQRGRDRRSPQLACDTRQRTELLLLAARAFGKQQQRNDIDGLSIDGIVIDRLLETGEQAERRQNVLKPRVRYRHAAADAGRSELLALV